MAKTRKCCKPKPAPAADPAVCLPTPLPTTGHWTLVINDGTILWENTATGDARLPGRSKKAGKTRR